MSFHSQMLGTNQKMAIVCFSMKFLGEISMLGATNKAIVISNNYKIWSIINN